MIRRSKKAPSRSRSRATSRKVRKATLGTHVSRPQRSGGSSEPSFSSPRKSKRAERGFVSQVTPRTSTRESKADYLKRTQKRSIIEDVGRKRTIRTALVGIAIVVVIIAIVGFVGNMVFSNSATDRMAITDQATIAALSAPSENEPYYVLVAGEHYDPAHEYAGPGLLILARVDEAQKTLSFVNIPHHVRVLLKDKSYHAISEAQVLGGDAYLIDAVEEFSGVEISHFSKVGSKDFVQMVDALGGIEVDVKEEVDDSEAGVEYLSTGTQVLSGSQALTFMRASNFTSGVQMQMENQTMFLCALGKKLLESSGLERMSVMEAFAAHIKTTLTAQKLSSLADVFQGIDTESLECGKVPGFAGIDENTGEQFYYYSSDTWKALMGAMNSGSSMAEIEAIGAIDPSSFTITVRNGSGLTGAASTITGILEEAGYRVSETGNADSYVYDETLVVYHDSAYREAAMSVVETLGVGRAVASNGFYTFNTDVLVVFGSDWKPLN